ncbi:MAG: hypothetical protein KBB95_27930, partial [Deltaproteobacteria bacterium]|nr:hypothetical protein [Deltaproteobacteria bacterium]
RTEHLKRLARTQPDEPATCELTEDEIQVLIFAKRRIKTSVELLATTRNLRNLTGPGTSSAPGPA